MRVEMAMEVRDEMGVQVERLAAAAQALEELLDRETGREMSFSAAAGSREMELERKLMEAEATIASLRAAAAAPMAGSISGRKTVAAGVASLMAKHGVGGEAVDVGALDAALVSLSIEQRIAVKAQMMRSGLVG